ncbi:MAG: ChaN family lipoprotein [Nitrospinota bacterium]
MSRFIRGRRAARLAGGLALALWLGAPAAGLSAAAEESHPLRGRIWWRGGFLGEEALWRWMAQAKVIYLGERHDNPIHHQLQAKALKALLARGRKPALGFEMFTTEAAPALAKLLAGPGADLSKVPEVTGWRRRGWPDWEMYAPLVEIAHGAGLPVLATDLPRELAARVARGGLGELPVPLAKELALGPPDPALRAAVVEEFFDSHCRVIPRERLGGLFEAWRARNRMMALSLARALKGGADGAALITGAGHADRVTGIPPDLAALAPGTGQFSLAFAEVRAGEEKPEAYLLRPGAHDALWFTAPHPREDPCVKFRGSLERFRRGG